MAKSTYRLLQLILFVVGIAAILPRRAGAQAPPPVGGGGGNPVTITYAPSNPGTDTLTTLTLQISICASPLASDSATFNGSLISGFTVSNGCATKSASYTLAVGTNTWWAYGTSGPLAGDSSETISQALNVTHPAGNVKANGTPLSVSPNQDTSETFYVSNYTGSSMSDTLTPTCSGSGVSSCTVSPSTVTVASETPQLITVTYKTASSASSGTVQLKAKSGSFVDSASVPITVGYQSRLTVSTVYTNSEDQDQSRCYLACFAMATSMSTVPYISRDAARSVTLVYNGDRVASRPIINADVTVASVGGDTTYALSYLSLAAFIHQSSAWQKVVFVNGDTTIYYSASGVQGASAPYRLMGQFDASSFPNASYPLKMVVTAYYSDGHQDVVTDSSHHVVVYNTRGSLVAHGWTILGQNFRLNPEDGGSENESVGRGNGSAIMYNNNQCFSWGCSWSPPAGASVATQLVYLNSDTLDQVNYPDSSAEYFAPAGQTIMTISRTNDTVQYANNANSRLYAISDPYRMVPSPSGKPFGGHTYWYIGWDSSGLGIDSIVEPDSAGNPDNPGPGRVTLLTVNQTTGYLTKWKDPDGDSTLFGYDTEGRLDSITDRNGNLTRYTYDPNSWKLDSVITASVPIDSNSTGSTVNVPLRRYYFPPQTCALPSGRTSPTPSGEATPFLTSSICGYWINTAGHATHIGTDQWGQLLEFDNSYGYITAAYTRDGNGFPTQVTNSSLQTNAWTYSGPFMTSSTPAGQNTTFYKYRAFAQLDSIYGIGQPTQKFFVDTVDTYKRGHIDSVQVAGTTTMRYYAASSSSANAGRDTMTVDASNDTTVYAFDATTGNHNHVADEISGQYANMTFDGHGRVQTVLVGGLSGSALTTTKYDIINRPDTTIDALGRKTIYGYDHLYQDSITDPSGKTYLTTYNAVGWATSKTDPTNRTTSTTYNGFGLPAVATNRRGQTITYTYDHLGRTTSVTRPSAFPGDSGMIDSTYYSTYNDTVTVKNRVSTNVTVYSRPYGWVNYSTAALNGNTFTKAYYHDALGRIDSIAITTSFSGGIDPYTRYYYYDPVYAYLDSLKLRTQKIAFVYNALFQDTSVTYPTSVVRHDAYTSTLLPLTTSWTGLNEAVWRGYGYDSTGRIIEEDIDGYSYSDTTNLFNYDAVGHLTQHEIGIWADSLTCEYEKGGSGCIYGEQRKMTVIQNDSALWDLTDNLDSVKIGSADTAGALLSGGGNRLSAWGGLTFGSDTDGDRTSMSNGSVTTSYIWSADGLLRRVTRNDTTRTYYYDGAGQLVFRSDSIPSGFVYQFYLWDKGQLLAILDGTAKNRVAEFAYLGKDQPIARITGNDGSDTVHYYAQDAVGNVFGQWNGASATLEQDLAYDPWGAPTNIATTTTDTTQLRWKGLLYEGGVTSLYYMRARWYDPATRRFVSPDPVGLSAGINQFAFAGGDPVNGSDPTGLDLCDPYDSPGGCAGGDIPPDSSGDSLSLGDSSDVQGPVTDSTASPSPDSSQSAIAGPPLDAYRRLKLLVCLLAGLCGPASSGPNDPPDDPAPPTMDPMDENYRTFYQGKPGWRPDNQSNIAPPPPAPGMLLFLLLLIGSPVGA